MLSDTNSLHRRIWLQGLQSATQNTKSIPADRLIAFYEAGRNHIISISSGLWADFAVITGLVQRRNYDQAASILKRVVAQSGSFNALQLTISVETFTMANRPDLAFCLLLEFAKTRRSTDTHIPDDMAYPPHPSLCPKPYVKI